METTTDIFAQINHNSRVKEWVATVASNNYDLINHIISFYDQQFLSVDVRNSK